MLRTITATLSLLILLFSVTYLVPLAISTYYNDGSYTAFLESFVVTVTIGFFLRIISLGELKELRIRDGFLIVVLFWTVLCFLGSLPLYLSVSPDISFTDSVFEGVSGLTTTGSTVLTNIDELPISIRYYRQQMHFLGGLSIIILAVAVFPMLGIGGMQLFRSEGKAPLKDNKLTPRIKQSAKALWMIYIALIIMCCVAYLIAGIPLIDAVGLSFSTVATGGFSPYDASMGHFDNTVKLITVFFMIMGSLNFYHHYFAVTRLNLGIYFKNTEIKVQMAIIAAITLLGLMLLTNTDSHSNFFDSFVNSLFHTVSLATTTGYSADNFSQWPSFIPILMLLAGVIGGCVGSTTGGFKVMRLVVLFKQGLRELKSLSHPNGIFSLKMDNMLIPNKVASAVAGFIAIYMLLFFLIMILLMATGLDFISAFTSAIASLANVGPGLGDASEHFAYFSDSAKWIMSCAMLLGRLEIFTLLILLTPTYWRS